MPAFFDIDRDTLERDYNYYWLNEHKHADDRFNNIDWSKIGDGTDFHRDYKRYYTTFQQKES